MKKRYQLTLTQETTEELKRCFDVLGIPDRFVSSLVDDLLKFLLPAIQRAAELSQRGDEISEAEAISIIFERVAQLQKL